MGAAAWSATRARTFQECRRKYYYRYHLAPLGRAPEAPPDARTAHQVKDLVGLEAWVGDLVHQVIGLAFGHWRAGRTYSEELAVAEAFSRLSRQFRDSATYWGAHPDAFPRRPVLLDLHYHGDGSLSRQRAAELKERAAASLRAFFRSELARRIRGAGSAGWLPIDRNAAARLGDVLVLVKPDFAFRDGDLLVIVDWKTGAADPFWEVVQLTCYALYAAEKWHTPLERIEPQIVHLYPHFRVSDAEYTPASVRDVRNFILESQAEMGELLHLDGPPVAAQFSVAEDSRVCGWCSFRGLCDGARRG